MPGYGISESATGLLPWSWAEERLTAATRYWLATVSPDGAPHVMPVWGVWIDGHLLFSTGGRSRKARNLRGEPRCAVHLDGEDLVIVHGTAEVVGDSAAAPLDVYAAKYGGPPPDAGENPLFRIRPRWAFGLVEAELATSATRWDF
jgi:PPOX class probable F420-dependent enzyme